MGLRLAQLRWGLMSAVFNYPEMATIAAELLAEFGQTAMISRHGQPQYNTATQSYAAPEMQYSGNAAVFNFKNNEIDGHRIVAGDMKIYLERVPIAPQVDDKIAVNGKVWRIKDVSPLSPAGYDVIYILQAGA